MISILQTLNTASWRSTFLCCFRKQNSDSNPPSDAWSPGPCISLEHQPARLLSKTLVKKTFPPTQDDEWWMCCKVIWSFPSGDVPRGASAADGQLFSWSSWALTTWKHLFHFSEASTWKLLSKKFIKSGNCGNAQGPSYRPAASPAFTTPRLPQLSKTATRFYFCARLLLRDLLFLELSRTSAALVQHLLHCCVWWVTTDDDPLSPDTSRKDTMTVTSILHPALILFDSNFAPLPPREMG